jgi:hypothetical protein
MPTIGLLAPGIEYEIDFTAEAQNSGVTILASGWMPTTGGPTKVDYISPGGFAKQGGTCPTYDPNDPPMLKLEVHGAHPIGKGTLVVTQLKVKKRWLAPITGDAIWLFGVDSP